MILVKFSMCFSYFIIGGLATTNILRLLRGSKTKVLSSKCVCETCNVKISVLNQTPIVSYFFSKGKCKYCGTSLPISALVLEIVIFIGMTLITAIGKFSMHGVLASFAFYEIIKIVYIIKFGCREDDFILQYILSLIAMVPYLFLIEFMALLITEL